MISKTFKEDLCEEVDLSHNRELEVLLLMLLLFFFHFLDNVGFFVFPLIVVLLELRTIPLIVPILLTSKAMDFGHISFILSLWTKLAKFSFSLGHSSKCLLLRSHIIFFFESSLLNFS